MSKLLWLLLALGSNATNPVDAVLQGEFHARLDQIHQLGSNLNESDRARLLAWLVVPSGEAGEATLKNDLLNVLRGQSRPVTQLADSLRAIYANASFDVTMRDYALQHLAALGGHNATLWQATTQSDSSLAGTALLALARTGEPSLRLSQVALAVASDPSASDFSRIPALRVCGQLANEDAAQLARQLIAQPGSDSLKMAAIATLGELGDETDIDEMLRHGSTPRLLPASQRALKLLQDKPKKWSGS